VALEKAVIEPEGELPIPVLFNPGQYGLDKSNRFAEIGVPGRGAPTLQFVSGNGRTLSLELFFDTYERQSDVRDWTNAIYGLLSIRATTHVPPICTFRWGDFSFRGVVEQVSGRFTLFLADGTPVRATLTLSMREFVDATLEARRTPPESTDRTKAHTVAKGETLHSIAALEYGDPAQWRLVATANGVDDPLALAPGTALVLPRLPPAGMA
jgi:nucleoid-associated protein YgaU